MKEWIVKKSKVWNVVAIVLFTILWCKQVSKTWPVNDLESGESGREIANDTIKTTTYNLENDRIKGQENWKVKVTGKPLNVDMAYDIAAKWNPWFDRAVNDYKTLFPEAQFPNRDVNKLYKIIWNRKKVYATKTIAELKSNFFFIDHNEKLSNALHWAIVSERTKWKESEEAEEKYRKFINELIEQDRKYAETDNMDTRLMLQRIASNVDLEIGY